jgi:hypothetical protein
MRSPADASFARFQRTRDPVALAAVFDATRRGLLLVAMHLCGGRGRRRGPGADRVPAGDPRRRVLRPAATGAALAARDPSSTAPATCGAARSAAANVRRCGYCRGSAAVRRPTAPPRVPRSCIRWRRALDSLEPMYREVLTLRLVHGLRAVDIARAAGGLARDRAHPHQARSRPAPPFACPEAWRSPSCWRCSPPNRPARRQRTARRQAGHPAGRLPATTAPGRRSSGSLPPSCPAAGAFVWMLVPARTGEGIRSCRHLAMRGCWSRTLPIATPRR